MKELQVIWAMLKRTGMQRFLAGFALFYILFCFLFPTSFFPYAPSVKLSTY